MYNKRVATYMEGRIEEESLQNLILRLFSSEEVQSSAIFVVFSNVYQ